MRTLPNLTLKTALWKKGLKQIDMALDMGIDPSRLSKIINGREMPTNEIKKNISNYLDIEINKLFTT